MKDKQLDNQFSFQTRWSDNDIYGHMNNAHYVAYFDAAINKYLIEKGGLDIHRDSIVGFIVDAHYKYHHAVAYPDEISVSVRVKKVGNSSVTYALSLYKKPDQILCSTAEMTHVFVDRETKQSTPIPEKLRSALLLLQV